MKLGNLSTEFHKLIKWISNWTNELNQESKNEQATNKLRGLNYWSEVSELANKIKELNYGTELLNLLTSEVSEFVTAF